MPNDQILITGGCGFIGRNLVKKLLTTWEKVIIVDNLSTGSKCYLDDESISERTVLYTKDVRNEREILEIFKHHNITHCVHLAAKTSVEESVLDPWTVMSVNVGGTLSVLQACKQCKVRNFVFASSAAVYGDVVELPIKETAPVNPLSPYGATKVAGEALVSAYSSGIKNVFCLRFFNVYGRGQSAAYSGVISKFSECVKNGYPLTIYGNGDQLRDFVYIDDVTRIIVNATAYYGAKSHYKLNVGTGKSVSINFLAMIVQRVLGRKTTIIYEKVLPGDIAKSYCDTTTTERILSYRPATNLESGLGKMLRVDT